MFFICNVFTYPLFIVLAVGLSYVFYRLIEKPAHSVARMITRKYLPAVI
jgi:peptidoglycan/LPS O-acetylase OafA/YrhL